MKTTDRIAGAALAAGHFLTAYLWRQSGVLNEFAPGKSWPLYADWGRSLWRSLTFDPWTAKWLLSVYAALALWTAFEFLTAGPVRARRAKILLTLVTSIKLVLFLSRYNLMGNYHLMHFIMTAVFLCGARSETYRLFLCLFYFMAGWLKWNADWLSGAALLSPTFLTGPVLAAALAYALVLENFLVWGLLSARWWLRRITLVQLVLFHIFSWHIVGYYYPLIMFCLLAPLAPDFFKAQTIDWRSVRGPAWAAAAALALFNLFPWISGQDPALEGSLRNLRFNMLDARPACRTLLLLESAEENAFLARPTGERAMRVRCDPAVITSEADRYCENLPPGSVLHLAHFARRSTDVDYRLILDEKDYCGVRKGL